MRRLAGCLLAAALLCAPATTAGADPASATVMIRVLGEVTAALGVDARVWRPSVEVREVELATGSGFIIAASGYILTNSHVIRSERLTAMVEGQPVELTLSVRKITVVLTGETGAERTFEAAVVADDPAVDLAILNIGAGELPVVSLGDAGSLQRGDPVTAWGYPLGKLLNVDTPEGAAGPPVSAASGSVAALREGGAAGLPASVPYVQFTAPINPGASGGPLTDRDGYVVGVVQAKITRAEGVGFAISVEEVRRFLERTGIDAMLPVTRLAPGALFDLTGKGVRMQLPAGFADASATRTRIDSGSSLGQVRMLVDRVATPWDAARMERTLLEGRAFAHGESAALPDRVRSPASPNRIRLGMSKQSGESGELRMMYALADVGDEMIVARYVASADEIAFNFSVLRDSLLSIEAVPLASRPLISPLGQQMVPVPATPEAIPITGVPAFTTLEVNEPGGCAGLGAPAGSVVAALDADFTVRFVATWWAGATSAGDVGRACLGGAAGRRRLRTQQFGVTWAAERVVVTTPSGAPVLLELWAPEARSGLATDAFLAWARLIEGPGAGGDRGQVPPPPQCIDQH